MNTAQDAFAAIARRGQDHFAASALAHSHARVTRRVRTARVAQTAVGATAAVGVVAAAGVGYATWRDHGSLVPAGTDSAPASGSASPTEDATRTPPLPVKLSVYAGATVDAIASDLADAYGVTHEVASAAIADAVRRLAPQAATVEGWLAYGDADLRPYATVEEAADYLVGARVAELTALGVEQERWQEVLTIASLVEKESARPEDKAKVARVILNRLEHGMPLQLDSTTRYAAINGERFDTNAYAGLPPGAIAIPAHGSLRAVLEPEEGDWLYFVVVDPATGETAYATTAAEHHENIALLTDRLAGE